jgi:tetratricopeptide (TPR) repeat protein
MAKSWRAESRQNRSMMRTCRLVCRSPRRLLALMFVALTSSIPAYSQGVQPASSPVVANSELAARWLAIADSSALVPADRAIWQRRFNAARDTAASVVDWNIANARADDALHLITGLSRFWTGPTIVSAYDRALALSGADPRIRARALNTAAFAAFRVKDQERTKRWANESIRMWLAIGDSAQAGRAYERLVQVALRDDDHAALRALADTGSGLCIRAKDADCQAYMLNMRGESARVLKQYDSAAAYYDQAGAIYSRLSPVPRLDIVHNMGFAQLAGGHVSEACERFRGGLASAVSTENKTYYPFMLAGLASCEAMRGNATQAARLFGVSDEQLAQLGIVADPADAVEYERYRTVARSKIGQAAFDAAVKAGRALPIDSVIASFK